MSKKQQMAKGVQRVAEQIATQIMADAVMDDFMQEQCHKCDLGKRDEFWFTVGKKIGDQSFSLAAGFQASMFEHGADVIELVEGK